LPSPKIIALLQLQYPVQRGNLKYEEQDNSGNTGTLSRAYSVKSLEIPLTLKMRTNEMNGLRYYGQIGLGTSFRFGAKVEDEFTFIGLPTTTYDKVNYDDISFLRESLIIGLGAEYTLDAELPLAQASHLQWLYRYSFRKK
jgi:hypothetical protein